MTEKIQPPRIPRASNPRNAKPISKPTVPYSARAIRPAPPITREQTFLEQLQAFLNRENAAVHSNSDRVNVYKRAFEFLINEFTLCRPLISRIKQQYDEMSSNLLEKHREMVVDSSSVTQNEDQFSELVNQMRRAKAKEFKKCHEDSEKLLDEMTDLRLQRSELLKQLEEIETQKRELKSVEAAHAESMQVNNAELHDINSEVKQIENEKNDLDLVLMNLEDKIEQIRCSEKELNEKDGLMKNELAGVLQIENEKKQILDEKMDQLRKLEIVVQDMNKDVIGLQREKKSAEEKLESNKQRKTNNEVKIREMLKEYSKTSDFEILDIVKKVLQ